MFNRTKLPPTAHDTAVAHVRAAVDLALDELTALDDAELRRFGIDPAAPPTFAARTQALLDAGDVEQAARVAFAALSGLLRAHARALLHPGSAEGIHRPAIERIGAAVEALIQQHGERSLQPGKAELELAGLRPSRRSRRSRRRFARWRRG